MSRNQFPIRPAAGWLRGTLVWALVTLGIALHAADDSKRSFDISAGDASVALKAFIEQSGREIMYPVATVEGVRTNGVKGQFSPKDALDRMLSGTVLEARLTRSGVLSIVRTSDPNDPGAIPASRDRPQSHDGRIEADGSAEKVVKMDTFEVFAGRTLNMDIPRSRDDAQPYVIFNHDTITSSGAVSLEDFLKNRLPMNTAGLSGALQPNGGGNRTLVNLRGLGGGQTLVLIDGRRLSNAVRNGAPSQPDLNGIPLAAIERIEILPTTASGVYGGGATGGVLNVILRRNYRGAEVRLSYDNTFDSDSAVRKAEFAAGFTSSDGRTQWQLSGSYTDGNSLAMQDRNFLEASRARRLASNPTVFLASPPLGATPNIRSSNGSPLFGAGSAAYTFVPAGFAGGTNAAATLAAVQPQAGKYNLAGAAAYTIDGGGLSGLVTSPEAVSLAGSFRRRLTDRLDVFVDANGSRSETHFPYDTLPASVTVPSSAPGNPFGQSVVVRYAVRLPAALADAPTLDQELRFVTGAIVRLPGGWQGEVDYSWSRSKASLSGAMSINAGAFSSAVASGAVNVFRDTTAYPIDLSPYYAGPVLVSQPTTSTFQAGTVRASGPIVHLPAGDMNLSAMTEYRDERFGQLNFVLPTLTRIDPARSQRIATGYLEARAPLFAESQRIPGVQRLELQLAVRHDDYRLNGAGTNSSPTAPIIRTQASNQSTDPTVGLKWEVTPDVALRASYGTGFLPPGVNQLAPSTPGLRTTGDPDPRRGNTPAPAYTTITGGNPNLRPEESESWSAGVVLTPRSAPDLRLSVDYTKIHKTDNIATHPQGFPGLIADEALFPGRVMRGANIPGDPVGWAGPITQVDATLLNIAEAEVEAYDAQVDYRWKFSAAGTFDFFGIGSWQPHYRTRLLERLPFTENAGIAYANPSKFKGNAGITWSHGRLSAGWTVRYFNSYVVSTSAAVIANQGSAKVPSQTYHDVFAKYSFAGGGDREGWRRLASDLDVTVGVRNVFNEPPPLDMGISGLFYSPLGDPRMASYYVSLRRAF